MSQAKSAEKVVQEIRRKTCRQSLGSWKAEGSIDTASGNHLLFAI